MKVVTIENGGTEWDTFVSTCGNATAYHRYGWRAVIERSFSHRCHYLAAVADDGKWRGILPLVHMRSRIFGNFLVSMPFVNYGGLLCQTDEADPLLLEAAEVIRRSCGATHAELRHVERIVAGLPTKQHKVTMILNLAGSIEDQWQAFDPKLRNQIRKAQKSKLELRVGHLDLLDGFYEVFARNMRDLGTPVYARRFFHNIMQNFADTTGILAVFHEGKVIAAGIACWFKSRVEVPWASSIRDYKALCPNHMLYWEAIRFAIDHGFREFDFGRSTPNEGTFNFKKQWGAAPIQLNWQYLLGEHRELPDLSPGNPKYRLAIRAWQRLPVWVSKAVGPSIVRNVP